MRLAEGVASAGGVWVALAADGIEAERHSISGSRGGLGGGFGFPGLLGRIGVERRLRRAGARKGMLDPFLEEKSADVKRLKSLQADIHESFKDQVRERRAGKLKAPEKDLFSGEFWTGRRALELGLIDGLGDLRGIMRERFGGRVRRRLVGGGRRAFGRPLLAPRVPRGAPRPTPDKAPVERREAALGRPAVAVRTLEQQRPRRSC